MNLKKTWTIYMIHHSHLDVGYTHTAAEISARYTHFLNDILSEIDAIHAGKEETKGYKYVVESFWIIDQYVKRASTVQREKLLSAIAEGAIEVTGSYFNFTDSIHPRIYGALTKRAVQLGKQANTPVKAAMFSDVNGLNLNYALELAKHGVEYLFTNVHSGHGIYALNEKLVPFRWKLPDGQELLVYNGDLYTYGNEFGFSPRGSFSDVIDDEGFDAKSYNYNGKMQRWMELATKRFETLLGYLESIDHPFDFVAMGLHGTDDDNAIPNPGIVPRIDAWNQRYGNQVKVRLVTLTEFFEAIKETPGMHTYEGDWGDWWSDGIGSAPWHFQYFKRLQTEYLHYLDTAPEIVKPYKEEIETTVALFAEHTFGHFMSVNHPHLYDAGSIQLVKEGYVGRLIQLVNEIKFNLMDRNGANCYSVDVSNRFLIQNPTGETLHTVIALRFDKYDLYTFPGPYKIEDSKGRLYSYWLKTIPELRAQMPHISIELAPYESLTITVLPWETPEYRLELFEKAFHVHAAVGYEQMADLHPLSTPKSTFLFEHVLVSEDRAETSRLAIRWNERGLYSIVDKPLQTELLNGREMLGAPVFEMNKKRPGPVSDDMEANRRYAFIGRNKRTLMTERYFGKIDLVDLIEDNPYYFELAFDYELRHFDGYRLSVRCYKHTNKIELGVKLTKNYVAREHNLYIALPLTTKDNQVYLDRGGRCIEAWREHLPGTLTDHTTVFGGLVVRREDLDLAVSCPDVYLLHLKSLKYEPVVLMCDSIRTIRDFDLFSWPICTLWNCNFFSRESNHLNLHYTIQWEKEIGLASAMEHFKQASIGPIQHKV